MTSAVVFVISKYLENDANQCLDYCAARGYEIAGLVRDDWDAALNVIRAGLATVVVVAAAERLDASCTPRMEVVAGQPIAPPAAANSRRRRTNRIFQPGAEA